MKNRQMITRLLAASMILAVSQVALAQGVGNLGSLPTVFPGPVPPWGWVVTDAAGGPVPVELDPKGPGWIKSFTGPNNGPFPYMGGTVLHLEEHLIVAGDRPWTDWHETILSPNWEWANPTILVNGVPATGLVINNLGNSLDFYFDPVLPGSQVIIRKDFVSTLPSGVVADGTIRVAQFPTPEPATMGLLALGSLAALRRRRRPVA